MGLSIRERRALAEIERHLTAAEPDLSARFATLPAPAAPAPTAPQRPSALAPWYAIAAAVLLFLLAAFLHLPLLTGIGLVLLLAGGASLRTGRRRGPRGDPRA